MTSQVFKQFMLDFQKIMVAAQKEKILLLVDNFSRHNMANIASQLNVIRLEFFLQIQQVTFSLWMQGSLHHSKHSIERF
jgi:hypothetical protein